jgi:hypothetical protein
MPGALRSSSSHRLLARSTLILPHVSSGGKPRQLTTGERAPCAPTAYGFRCTHNHGAPRTPYIRSIHRSGTLPRVIPQETRKLGN